MVQGALTRLDGVRHRSMTLAIGFGGRRAGAARRASAALRTGFSPALARFTAGWRGYLASLPAPPAPVAGDAALTRLYQQSIMVLAASEDKLNRGASIASPSMPWVWGTLTLSGESFSGPYHLVWPRDFYHVATAMQAAGDGAAATRLVDYLWRVQKADGSWWQNTKVDGEKFWTSLQLDEVALPVVLAWWLGRRGADDWRHVRAAADFIALKGPKTQQERWENQEGWSPNTIATEIAALICAADIARANGDPARAASYEAKADDWQAKVESWTATSTGPYTPKPYYLRITKDADPNAGTPYELGDNLPDKVDQRTIVDNSFLGLVLFGVKRWDDPTVLNSLAVGDAQLGTTLPGGRMWHRFSRDGYGETAQGGDWDIFKEPAAQTLGRAWPLLSGERGEYELLAGRGAGSLPGDDREQRERRADAARAGLGRAAAGRRDPRRGDAVGHAAGLDARAVHPARVVDRRGRAGRASEHRRLPLHRPGLLSARRSSRLSRSARRTRHPSPGQGGPLN